MAELSAVFGIEKRSGNRAVPPWQDGLDESGLPAFLFAVVGENGFIAGEEAAHEDHFAVAIEIDAHDVQALRTIFFGQVIEQRVFVAAGFAPGGPEVYEE